MAYRIESDTFGNIKVPQEKYYGAQTARSLVNFKIGTEKFPFEFIKALATVKKAAAITNAELKLLSSRKKAAKGVPVLPVGIIQPHFINAPMQQGCTQKASMATHFQMRLNTKR